MRVSIVLSLWLVACGPEVGAGEEGTGSDGSGSPVASADETGPGADGCDGVCVFVQNRGEPWRGPIAIATVADVLSHSCPEGTHNIGTLGHALVDADAPCECWCGPPSCTTSVSIHAVAGCEDAPQSAGVGPGCLPVEVGASIRIETPTQAEACEPRGWPPDVSFDLHTALCEAEPGPLCVGGGRCVPTSGLDGVVCWLASGEHECPPELPDRRIVYAATNDQRTCAEGCECSGAPVCAGGVTVHDSCIDRPEQEPLLPGECLDLAGPVALLPDFTVEGECAPSVANVPVVGEIFADSPRTLCCTAQ